MIARIARRAYAGIWKTVRIGKQRARPNVVHGREFAVHRLKKCFTRSAQ
jgi:hypothetical protein